MNRSKQKGTSWESRIVETLIAWGWPHAERRTLSGANDRGDISGIVGVVIEAKNEQKFNLAGWLNEAHREADNAKADIGVVWAHRPGHASPEKGYVLMDGATFMSLLTDAGYGGIVSNRTVEEA